MGKRVYRSTLLALVCAVQDYAASDDEAVAIIADMLNTGRVVLTGTFAGSAFVPGEGTNVAPRVTPT
jgi:hypothetical protein